WYFAAIDSRNCCSISPACGCARSICHSEDSALEPISKLAAQPDYFVVSSLGPRCTSMYYLGPRCGPSRTRAARPILRQVLVRFPYITAPTYHGTNSLCP